MAYTDINSEDRLVQATFVAHLAQQLGWESAYAWNTETSSKRRPTGFSARPITTGCRTSLSPRGVSKKDCLPL